MLDPKDRINVLAVSSAYLARELLRTACIRDERIRKILEEIALCQDEIKELSS